VTDDEYKKRLEHIDAEWVGRFWDLWGTLEAVCRENSEFRSRLIAAEAEVRRLRPPWRKPKFFARHR
jgi:hypothetical protein